MDTTVGADTWHSPSPFPHSGASYSTTVLYSALLDCCAWSWLARCTCRASHIAVNEGGVPDARL